MNIFWLSKDDVQSSYNACDQHILKMCLEYSQIISTVLQLWRVPGSESLYKITHVNHPCVKWAAESFGNLIRLVNITRCYDQEYGARYKPDISVTERAPDYGMYHAAVRKVLTFFYANASKIAMQRVDERTLTADLHALCTLEEQVKPRLPGDETRYNLEVTFSHLTTSYKMTSMPPAVTGSDVYYPDNMDELVEAYQSYYMLEKSKMARYDRTIIPHFMFGVIERREFIKQATEQVVLDEQQEPSLASIDSVLNGGNDVSVRRLRRRVDSVEPVREQIQQSINSLLTDISTRGTPNFSNFSGDFGNVWTTWANPGYRIHHDPTTQQINVTYTVTQPLQYINVELDVSRNDNNNEQDRE